MAKPKRDNERAARALVDAYLYDNAKAAESNGVTVRTIQNYKRALAEDDELSCLFREYLHEFLKRDWAAELDETLSEAIAKMRQLILSAESLAEVTDAFKALAEVGITREVLRAGANDAEPDRGHTAQGRTATAQASQLPN